MLEDILCHVSSIRTQENILSTALVGLKRKSLLLGQNEGSTTCQKKNRRFSGEPYPGENHGNVEMSWHKKEGNVGPLTTSFSQDAQAF